MDETAVADEGRGNTREGNVLGLALVSPVQATAAGSPGHRAFHDPAMAAQALGGLDATADNRSTTMPRLRSHCRRWSSS